MSMNGIPEIMCIKDFSVTLIRTGVCEQIVRCNTIVRGSPINNDHIINNTNSNNRNHHNNSSI